MNQLSIVGLRMLSGVLLALCLPLQVPAQTQADVVSIGLGAPLSGIAEPFGKSFFQAAQVAIDQANEAGVVLNGRRVTLNLVAADDRGDARSSRIAAQYLIKKEVVGVVGHGMTAPSLTAAPVYAEAGIPMITGSSSSKELTERGYRNVFRTIGHDDSAALHAAVYVREVLKARRAAVVDDGSAFGVRLARQFGRAFTERAGTVTAQASINDKTSDFNEVLNLFKGQQVEVVFFGGSVRQAAELLVSMRRLGLSARLMTGSNGAADKQFLDFAGNSAGGALSIEPGIPPEKMPQWKQFAQAYAQRGNAPMSTFAPYVYDAAQALVAALKAAGTPDPGKVAQALHKLHLQGLTGRLAFDDQGNLLDPGYTIYEVRQGGWQVVRQIGPAK